MSEDLAQKSAIELVALYRSKEASPVEAVGAVLERIDQYNPVYNCMCLVDEDRALAAAKASQTRWLAGEELGEIDGVPATIKDLTLTQGWPTLRGSKTVDPAGPWTEDAPATARLREAGAVLVGKTTTPEFGWKGVTDNPLTGITRNPWNRECTPGGSSGGAAAAAALLMGPLHQGSDAAGSIRIPAAFTGVFGHKPTFGLVPNYPLPGHIGSLAHMGPITRTVCDAAAMLGVLARPDHRDFMAGAPSVHGADYLSRIEDGIEGVRIAYSPTLGAHGWADDDVAARVEDAARVLAGLGAIVEEADPQIPDPRSTIEILWAAADAWLVSSIPADRRGLIDPGLVEIAERGGRYGAQDVIAANVARIDLGVAMARFHERYDLLMTPQMPLEAFEAGQLVPQGRGMSEWIEWSPFTYPFNLTMQPACSVPCGFGDDGLPVAFQLVGRHWEDELVLRAARSYERACPFAMP